MKRAFSSIPFYRCCTFEPWKYIIYINKHSNRTTKGAMKIKSLPKSPSGFPLHVEFLVLTYPVYVIWLPLPSSASPTRGHLGWFPWTSINVLTFLTSRIKKDWVLDFKLQLYTLKQFLTKIISSVCF